MVVTAELDLRVEIPSDTVLGAVDEHELGNPEVVWSAEATGCSPGERQRAFLASLSLFTPLAQHCMERDAESARTFSVKAETEAAVFHIDLGASPANTRELRFAHQVARIQYTGRILYDPALEWPAVALPDLDYRANLVDAVADVHAVVCILDLELCGDQLRGCERR